MAQRADLFQQVDELVAEKEGILADGTLTPKRKEERTSNLDKQLEVIQAELEQYDGAEVWQRHAEPL